MAHLSKAKAAQNNTVRKLLDGIRGVPPHLRAPIQNALRLAYTTGRRVGYDKGVEDERRSQEEASNAAE